MSLSSELDTWAAGIATATGYRVTRDPDRILPPCLFVDFPSTAAVTIGEVTALEVPVWVVAKGAGKAAGDQLLDMLETAFAALEPLGRQANAGTLSVAGTEYHAMQATVRLHVTPTPPPEPDPVP